MKRLFRIFGIGLLVVLFFTIATQVPAFAQTKQNTQPNYFTDETNPDVPQNLHSLTQIVTTEVAATMICQLSGIDILQKKHSCLGIDPQTNRIGFTNHGGGLIGATMKGIGFTMDIPIHSGDYVQYIAAKFGTEKTYAAEDRGFGFAGLKPLLNLWMAFRNIVYLLFVVIFVLIGLAIMLRVQIDPRTVMTLENQLPKIIIGLILVTFSYAIAGFLIDIMWLFTFLIINTLASVDKQATDLTQIATLNIFQFPLGYLNEVLKTSGPAGIWSLAMGGASSIHAVIVSMFDNNGTALQDLVGVHKTSGCDFGWGWFGCEADKALEATLQGIMNFFIVFIIDIIAFLVIVIALFLTMFRIWFMLLKAYIHIILEVILAPFYIAGGLIPGSSIGFGTWVRSMCSNLLAFPVTIFMFVLARVLLDSFFPNGSNTSITSTEVAPGGSLFLPPLISNPNSNSVLNPLGVFIALGVIFAIPEILKNIRKALQTVDLGLGVAALGHAASGGKAGGSAIKGIGGASMDYFTGRNPVVPKGAGAVFRGLFGR